VKNEKICQVPQGGFFLTHTVETGSTCIELCQVSSALLLAFCLTCLHNGGAVGG